MCHLFDHICSDCHYAAPVRDPSHQTLTLKLWRRTDLVHTIDELLINSKIPTLKERRSLLKLSMSYLFQVQDKWVLFIFKYSPSPCIKLPRNSESQLLFLERPWPLAQTNAFIYIFHNLLIRNNFIPLIVIIICRCLIIS